MSEQRPDSDAARLLAHLEMLGSEESRAGMARFGIRTEKAFGISNEVLHGLARQVKRDRIRAEALWRSGWREARLLATFTDEPEKVTRAQVERWADDLDSWEIVDSAAWLFGESGLAHDMVPILVADDREFVRRLGFSMMAWAAVHLRKEPDATFLAWLRLVETYATDDRNFVRKAVNWALRQIGKRSIALHAPALALARALAASENRALRWIGKDAVKELTSEKVLARLSSRGA